MSFSSLNLRVNRTERKRERKVMTMMRRKRRRSKLFHNRLSIISLLQSNFIASKEQEEEEEKKKARTPLMIDFCIYTRINVFQSLLLLRRRLRFQSTKK